MHEQKRCAHFNESNMDVKKQLLRENPGLGKNSKTI